jgi:hypothetical protein
MERTATPARIVQQLRKERVAPWHALAQQLDCSTKTVQRALAQVGYYNSLNYNATFVTLQDVPRFDQHGLWTYQDVHFSRHGNLPQTIRQLIERAPAGYTVEELEGLVGTRVPNHVSRLLREGALARCFQGRSVVYLAADPRRRESQETVRRQAGLPAAPAIPQTDLPPGLDALTVIAVLVRLLEAPEVSGASVARTLQARGRTVRAEQVRQIIAFYGLRKTTR